MAFEEVNAPVGTYVSWGQKKGQHVTGFVLDYDETGGNDFGNNPCPLLEIKLAERAASINKEGQRTDFDPGTVVMLSCGQASLKRKVKRANDDFSGLKGKLVKITLSDFVKVSNGTLKEFTVAVDASKTAPAGNSADVDDSDEPPF